MGADCGRGSAKAVDIYHPALLVSYQVGGPLTLTSSMKAAAMSGILSCMMNEIYPCRIWTKFVAPMGRVVRHNKLKGHLEGHKVPRFNGQALVVKGHEKIKTHIGTLSIEIIHIELKNRRCARVLCCDCI